MILKPLSGLLIGVLSMALVSALAAPSAVAMTSTEYIYEVLLDTDNNSATGGPVSVVQGSETPHDEVGIDYIVRVTAEAAVDEAKPTGPASPSMAEPEVLVRDVLKWNGSTSQFEVVDSDSTMYPLGMSDRHGLVEFGAPLSTIGNPGGSIRGVFHASQMTMAENDYTSSFLLKLSVGAPALSWRGLLFLALLLPVSGLALLRARRRRSFAALLVAAGLTAGSIAWAAAIVLDGDFADWAGINPVVTDPVGDSSIGDAAEDILAGYAVVQPPQIFFRMDLDGIIQPLS